MTFVNSFTEARETIGGLAVVTKDPATHPYLQALASEFDELQSLGEPLTVTPVGTTNTLVLFTSPTTLGNSIITQAGTTITVGGALVVNTTLGVTGAATLSSTASLTGTADGLMYFSGGAAGATTWLYATDGAGVARFRMQRNGKFMADEIDLWTADVNGAGGSVQNIGMTGAAGGSLTIGGTGPGSDERLRLNYPGSARITWDSTNAPTDSGKWRLYSITASGFVFDMLNDAENSSTTLFTVVRSGLSFTSWTFNSTPVIVGTDPGGTDALRVGGYISAVAGLDMYYSTGNVGGTISVDSTPRIRFGTGGSFRIYMTAADLSPVTSGGMTLGAVQPWGATTLQSLTVQNGPLVIGTDPGGTDTLRVGGFIAAVTGMDMYYSTGNVGGTISVDSTPQIRFGVGGAFRAYLTTTALIIGTDPGGSDTLRVGGYISAVAGMDMYYSTGNVGGSISVDSTPQIRFGVGGAYRAYLTTTALIIGTDPGGTDALRVGGYIAAVAGMDMYYSTGNLGGTISVDSTPQIRFGTGGAFRSYQTATAFIPAADATYDLGVITTTRWRNLYLSGTEIIGTDPGGSDPLRVGGYIAAQSGLDMYYSVGNVGGTISVDSTPQIRFGTGGSYRMYMTASDLSPAASRGLTLGAVEPWASVQYGPGTSTAVSKATGVVFALPGFQQTSSTSTVTLATYSYKANTLVGTNDQLRMWLTGSVQTQNGAIAVVWGATTIFSYAPTAGQRFTVEIVLWRDDATPTHLTAKTFLYIDGVNTVTVATVAPTDSSAADQSVTFQGSVTAGGTLQISQWIVETMSV